MQQKSPVTIGGIFSCANVLRGQLGLCPKLDGLEVYYPCHKPEDVQHYFFMAKRYDLLIAGGSDFHGSASRFVKELGDFTISDELAEKFSVKPPI